MTTVLLVRHCSVPALGRYLAGRAPGEHLDDAGRAQAAHIAQRFAGTALDAVYASPLERARETADAFASCTTAGVQCDPALTELDFGEWTGKTFAELAEDPRWPAFHLNRSTMRIPGGETLAEVQARGVRFLEFAAAECPTGRIAVVTHGDVIRTVLCHYLQAPLDAIDRFEIAPASVSVLDLNPGAPIIRCTNVVEFDPRRC